MEVYMINSVTPGSMVKTVGKKSKMILVDYKHIKM